MSPNATINKIKCTLSQSINKNTTGIHTQGLCMSMYVSCAQTWTCKYLTHTHKPHITTYKTEIKNKEIFLFFIFAQFHLAQCDPDPI